MYPEDAWSGRIVFEGDESQKPTAGGRNAMLFSGGLNSVTSVTRHIDEGLVLITVGGADMASTDTASWEALKLDVTKFSDGYDADSAFVHGNIKECLNTVRLSNMPGGA